MSDKAMVELIVEPRSHDAATNIVKLIAFYLPQFHPIPENDEWWGTGFTEWTNVTKARPLFDGHYQPRLPADLGFYDLRLREVRHQQIALAQKYGIYGFCYHYYWFSGARLLEKPIDDMLSDAESDMPFCLCWANENWTRRWDAKEHEILIEQKYLPKDDLDFIQDLIKIFQDRRYIKLNGAPFLIVYRPQQLPSPLKTTRIWRQVCKDAGIPNIHLCAALTHGNQEYEKYGFDSGVEFPPHNIETNNINQYIDFFARFRGRVFNYYEIAEHYLNKRYLNNHVFRTVFPSWDNTSRKNDRATTVLNSTPENYEYWLSETIGRTRQFFEGGDLIVFVNAWNEWAEGCYLEPDRLYQTEFLESTLRAVKGQSTLPGFQQKAILPQLRATERRTVVGDFSDLFRFHFDRALDNLRSVINRNPGLKKMMLSLIRLGRMIFQR